VKAATEWSCKLSTSTLYTVSDYTVWLIIAVTVERYVVVCHALSARVVCRRHRAVAVIVVLLAALLALNLHFFWTVGLRYVQVHGNLASFVCATSACAHDTDGENQLRSWAVVEGRKCCSCVFVRGEKTLISNG